MKTKLKSLSVEKIAIVPEGDNKSAEALIYKSRNPQPVGPEEPQPETETNGGIVDMKFDKSKLTPEEQAE